MTEVAPEFLIAADLLGPSEADNAWRREARPQQFPLQVTGSCG
jgi:hypothetical protein